MYHLANTFVTLHPSIVVVGVGGTGGFVAEGLCRLFLDDPAVQIILVDHDRVEPRNLGRQNFTREDLGKFKSEALAERLSTRYGRPVAFSVFPWMNPLDSPWVEQWRSLKPGLIIGCVDNALARSAIADWFADHHGMGWWVDAGNGDDYGQMLIGNSKREGLDHSFDPGLQLCTALPLPTLQRPELLLQAEPQPVDPNCADDVAAGGQSPTINQAMASVVLEVVRRLVAGTCPWMQVSIDLASAIMRPTLATPENVAAITGLRYVRRRRAA